MRIWQVLVPVLSLSAWLGAGMALAAQNSGRFAGPAGEVFVLQACGTPELLHDSSRRQAPADVPPARPLLAEEQVFISADGHFQIHYPGRLAPVSRPSRRHRAGRLRLPEEVRQVSEALIVSRQLLVEQEGWVDPMAGQPLEVYLVGGVARGGSLVVPLEDPFLTSDEGSASFVILAGPRRTWALQALHQYLHVLQVGQSMREEPWFYEASALYGEESLAGGQAGLAPLLARRFQAPQRSLTLDVAELKGSAAVFLAQLEERHGPGVLKLAWELAGRQPGEGAVMALDSALRLTDQTTFLAAFRDYTLLNAYPDASQRPEGTYASLGLPVPVAGSAWEVTSLPDGNTTSAPIKVEPLGAAYIRMHTLTGVAALHLELETSPETGIAGDVLVSDRHAPGGWVAVPLEFNAGRADLGLPLEAGGEVSIVLRNQRTQPGPVAAVHFAVVEDPSFPYDLAFLSADASPGQIDLSWGSESQHRMYGWRVYRSLDPRGPFHQMNRLPLPAMGDSDLPMAYHFIDTEIVPGTLYYYQVEGLTVDGLARRSATVVRRAAPRKLSLR